MKSLFHTALMIVASALSMTAASHAQTANADWPIKPSPVVVTFPPGGSSDAVVRMLVPRLNEKLGQQVVVDNRPGAAKSLRELIAQAKAAPGNFSVGHGGNGPAMHLSSQFFSQMAGVQLVDVPYRGSGPAALDALAGQIPLAMVDLTSALRQIRADKLVAFAVTSAQRLPMLPDMPTFAEACVPGYESTGWFGVVAPAGTPPAIVARLNLEIVATLNDPEIRNAIRNLGAEPAPMKAEEFEQYIKSEIQKWAKVIKTAGTKLE